MGSRKRKILLEEETRKSLESVLSAVNIEPKALVVYHLNNRTYTSQSDLVGVLRNNFPDLKDSLSLAESNLADRLSKGITHVLSPRRIRRKKPVKGYRLTRSKDIPYQSIAGHMLAQSARFWKYHGSTIAESAPTTVLTDILLHFYNRQGSMGDLLDNLGTKPDSIAKCIGRMVNQGILIKTSKDRKGQTDTPYYRIQINDTKQAILDYIAKNNGEVTEEDIFNHLETNSGSKYAKGYIRNILDEITSKPLVNREAAMYKESYELTNKGVYFVEHILRPIIETLQGKKPRLQVPSKNQIKEAIINYDKYRRNKAA